MSKFADSVIIIKTFDSLGELLSSLETTNFYISASELLVTSRVGNKFSNTGNMETGRQTGTDEGRLRREAEDVFSKRTLIYLLVLISVLFIIFSIRGITSLILVL